MKVTTRPTFSAPVIPLYNVWRISEDQPTNKFRYIGAYSVYQLQGQLTLDAMRRVVEEPNMGLYLFPHNCGPNARLTPGPRLRHHAERGPVDTLIKSFVKTFDAAISGDEPFLYVKIIKRLDETVVLEVGCPVEPSIDYFFNETGLEWSSDDYQTSPLTDDYRLPCVDDLGGQEPKGWPIRT